MFEFEEIAKAQAWTPETQVSVLLRYIENQDSDDAFLDFLGEQVAEEDAMSIKET